MSFGVANSLALVILATAVPARVAVPVPGPVGEIIGVEGGEIADIRVLRGDQDFVARPFEPLFAGDTVRCARAPLTIQIEIRGGSTQNFGCDGQARSIPQMNWFQWTGANIARIARAFPGVFTPRREDRSGRDTSPGKWRGQRIQQSPYLPEGELHMRAYAGAITLPVVWVGGAGHVTLADSSGSLRGEAWSKRREPGFARLNLLSLEPGTYLLKVEDDSHARLSWSLIVKPSATDNRTEEQRIVEAAEILKASKRTQDRLQALTELLALGDQDYTAYSLLRFVREAR